MPDFDGTGPEGKGPSTGRKRGKCRGSSSEPNKKDDGPGSGRRFGFRRGDRNNRNDRERGGKGSGRK